MFLNLDQLEKQLDKEEFQEIGSMVAFRVLKTHFQTFINSQFSFDDDDGLMTHKYFLEYTRIEVQQFCDTLIQHMESVKKSIDERAFHKREYDNRVNERQMQTKEGKFDTSKSLDASLVDLESSGAEFKKQDTSSRSGINADANIKPVYDEEPMAEKKTQKRGRNSRPSVMSSVRSQNTANGYKPKPRIDNQKSGNWPASKTSCITTNIVPISEHSRNSRTFSDSKDFVCSTCQKCVFNANHDTCVTQLLNEVNSRVKVLSHKITNRYKFVEQLSIAKKLERQIPTRHRFSTKMTSTMHEKIMTPRSCLRWKPTGRIFKTVGLRWVPTGKIFTSSTTKVESQPHMVQM
ncbi:hypothetical protein Tco_1212562 [Tanacetum coccineum]